MNVRFVVAVAFVVFAGVMVVVWFEISVVDVAAGTDVVVVVVVGVVGIGVVVFMVPSPIKLSAMFQLINFWYVNKLINQKLSSFTSILVTSYLLFFHQLR